eukprot:g30250.t1
MASSAVCERELLFQKAELQRQQQALERQRLHEAEELRQGRETLRALAEEVSLRAAERFQEAGGGGSPILRRAEAQVLRLRREVEELNAQVLAQERLAQDSVAELHLELQHALDEAPAARRAAPARAASSAGRSSVALSRRLSSQLGVRNMVDASSQRDLREASVYQTFMLPKLYMKMLYCVSCAIHGRVVRVRNKVLRASPEGRIYKPPQGKGGGKGN